MKTGLINNYGNFRARIDLGDWNIKTEEDCYRGRCIKSVVSRQPEEILIHTDFNQRSRYSDDIALIRLDTPVEYTG